MPEEEDSQALSGLLVYHSYSSYEAEDSKLFLFDLKSGERTELGSDCSPLAFDTPDADFSDPCPIGGGWVIFSSTLPGGNGGY